MRVLSSFKKLIENQRISTAAPLVSARAGRALESSSGTLWPIPTLAAALLLLLAAAGCQTTSAAGERGAGAGETCTPPQIPSAHTVAAGCSACPAECAVITPHLSICPDRAGPIATDCSPDVAKADNACACEGRTCADAKPCYKELVTWDSSEIHNACGPDPECLTSADCGAGKVCVPPFSTTSGVALLANPGGVCVTPECQSDADCTAAPCGVCGLTVSHGINSGRETFVGITCAYDASSK